MVLCKGRSGVVCGATSERGKRKKVVVVGGGVGGLVTAGRLVKQGCFESVTLLEKNAVIGGRMQSETIAGYRFDTGPSLLLFPNTYRETFDALDVDQESLELVEVSPAAYRVFFPDGDKIDLLHNVEDMMQQIESIEVGAGKGYAEFLKMAKKHLDLGMPYFIERDFTALSDAKGLLDLLPQATSINPWHLLGPYDLVLKQFFKSWKLRAAFTFQCLYVGLSPYNAPGVFSLLCGTEMSDGVFYPLGGFQQIRDRMKEAVMKLGVQIETSCPVSKIIVDETHGMVVSGVETDAGEVIPADIVVTNIDLPKSYGIISPANREQADSGVEKYASSKVSTLESYEYSNGIISFNWCLDCRLDILLHHNVFMSDNPRRAWRPAKNAGDLEANPNFYIHMPSKTDPSACPDSNSESVMVLLPVANLQQLDQSPESYSDLIQAGRTAVIRYLSRITGISDFESHIVGEKIIDPIQWEDMYGLKYGAAFGLSHKLDQLSLFRPANKDAVIKGLYFTGASTRPGNGVPLCMIGARLTAERIIKDVTQAITE